MSDQQEYPDDPGLRGKAAIVTGGGAVGDGIGNGRAAAILLARSGVRVLVADLRRELAENTVRMIEQAGGEAVAHGADVTDENQCREMVAAAMKRFGRLDFLDNNVGIGGRGSVVEIAPVGNISVRITPVIDMDSPLLKLVGKKVRAKLPAMWRRKPTPKKRLSQRFCLRRSRRVWKNSCRRSSAGW